MSEKQENTELDAALMRLFERTYDGLSGSEIARRTGLHYVTVSNIRKGKVKMSKSSVIALCKILPGLEGAIIKLSNKSQIPKNKEDIKRLIAELIEEL